MKKLLLLSGILLAAATSSHAGVRFGFGLGLPLPVPPLPGIAIEGPQAYVAPPPVYYDAPRAYYPPAYCPPAVVVEPYFGFRGYDRYHHYGYRDHRHGWDHHGWDRHGHGHHR